MLLTPQLSTKHQRNNNSGVGRHRESPLHIRDKKLEEAGEKYDDNALIFDFHNILHSHRQVSIFSSCPVPYVTEARGSFRDDYRFGTLWLCLTSCVEYLFLTSLFCSTPSILPCLPVSLPAGIPNLIASEQLTHTPTEKTCARTHIHSLGAT